MTSPAFAPFYPQHKACADVLSAQAFLLFFPEAPCLFPFVGVSAVPPLRCNLPYSPPKLCLTFLFLIFLTLFSVNFESPALFVFYNMNARTLPLFSLSDFPILPTIPLQSPCHFAVLSFKRLGISLLSLLNFLTLPHNTAVGKSCCFFRLPLPALQSTKRSFFATIPCPMIFRADQFVPAPFTRKFVIKLPFPTNRRSLSYVLSLLGL